MEPQDFGSNLSPHGGLNSQLFSEAACPPKGQKNRPPSGVGLRVLRVLWDEFPRPFQPKQVAYLAQTPHEGTKKWLQRNEGTWVAREGVVHTPFGRLDNGGGGWYRARATLQLLRKRGWDPLAVHALQMLVKSLGGGTPPQLGGLGTPRKLADGTVQRETEWNGRKVTIQPGAHGALVSIRASQEPISIPLFNELSAWLHGLATPGTVMVQNFDLATDSQTHQVRVAGAESLSLAGFHGSLLKVYHKRSLEVTRVEACFHRVNLDLGEVGRLLNELATPPYSPGLFPSLDPREVA